MKKWLKRLWENEKGFSLIELIIVIAILAIIAAVAIPNVLKAVDNSRRTSDVSEAKMLADAAAMILAKNDNAKDAVFDVDDALAITGLTAVGSPSDPEDFFINTLLTEFTNGLPEPSFQGTPVDEDSFYLVIDGANNIIEVWIDDDTNTDADDTGYQVYPTIDPLYQNQ